MLHPNTSQADILRVELAEWLAHNRWTPHALNVAMNRLCMKTMQGHRIEQFIAREYSTGADVLHSIARFLRDHPSPGTLEEMRADLDARARDAAERKEAALLSHRFDTERARAEHIRRHLEQEQAPRPKGWKRPFYMDKATVAALSGVRL